MLDPVSALWIGQLSERITKLERKVATLNKQMKEIWTWGQRLALIGFLWISGVAGNLMPAEKAATRPASPAQRSSSPGSPCSCCSRLPEGDRKSVV